MSHIKNLWKELAFAKDRLSIVTFIIDGFSEKRSALVEAISFIVSLFDTQESNEQAQQRSVVCTALPNKIDQDWENKELYIR